MGIELKNEITESGSTEPQTKHLVNREADMTHDGTAAQQLIEGTPTKRAAIFARVRVVPYDDVREFTQFKAQVRACRRVAAGLGAVVASVYEAPGGTSDPGVRQ